MRGTFVAAQQTLLPEALERAGYQRLVVTANQYVGNERGLLQGIDAQGQLGGTMEPYDSPELRGTVVRCRHEVHEKVIYASCGHLLSNITT